MDTMIEQKQPTLEARYRTLAEENKELKEKLVFARKYIEQQNMKIEKLERSMLSAVTSLKWGE